MSGNFRQRRATFAREAAGEVLEALWEAYFDLWAEQGKKARELGLYAPTTYEADAGRGLASYAAAAGIDTKPPPRTPPAEPRS